MPQDAFGNEPNSFSTSNLSLWLKWTLLGELSTIPGTGGTAYATFARHALGWLLVRGWDASVTRLLVGLSSQYPHRTRIFDDTKALEITADVCDGASLERWMGEPIKGIVIDTATFITNAKGYPVLSRVHQAYFRQLLKVRKGTHRGEPAGALGSPKRQLTLSLHHHSYGPR